MFYCRERELDELNRRYQRGRFECIVIYGRRRIGKTALINEFCKDKPTVFFSALMASAKDNLEALSRAIYTFQKPDGIAAPVYQNYSDALDAVTALSRDYRLIFVIDEYPYLAQAEDSISSRLQHIIDHVWQDGQLFLILCGSSVSFIENQVLGQKSPLFGRRTAQIRLQALDYRETAEFYPELCAEDLALLYGITGGIPDYINKLDVDTFGGDLDVALLESLFNPCGYLFNEPENLLKQELREPAIYNSVISAVAGGASRSHDIASRVGLEPGVCTKYLRVLLELGILEKQTPITEKPGRHTLYAVCDLFFRFWYRFIPRNMAAIETGRIREIYDGAVKRYFSDYMGLIFEKICRDYLLRYAENLPILLCGVGSWWGSDPKAHRQIQIDLVGTPGEGEEYLIGSCKYSNQTVDVDELELLEYYASVFGKGKKYDYYIFSKSGFTKNLRNLTNQRQVTLLTLADLYH